MASRLKPKPKPTESQPPANAAGSRPSRAANYKANENAVWNGAAPRVPVSRPPTSNSRKRSASIAQQSERSKVPKTSQTDLSYDVEERDVAPPQRQQRLYRKNNKAVHSDEEVEDSIPIAAPAPKKKAPKQPTPVQEQVHPDQLFEDENGDSGYEEQGDAEDNDAEPEVDDLEGLNEAAVKDKLEEAIPRWSNSKPAHDADNHQHYRSSSRASVSSGSESVYPHDFAGSDVESSRHGRSSSRSSMSSNVLPLNSMDISDDEDDLGLKAGLHAAYKHTLQSEPAPPVVQAKPSRPCTSGPAPTQKHPEQPLRRLDLSTVPSWAPSKPSASTSRGHVEGNAVELRKHDADNDVDASPGFDENDLSIRFTQSGGINLKLQHADIQKVIRLGLDYYKSRYIQDDMCPEPAERTAFALDALTSAAEDHRLRKVVALVELATPDGTVLSQYGEMLAALLHARISSFRGAFKTTAVSILFGDYKVQNNCVALVERLLKSQSFAYEQKPDVIDPRSQTLLHGGPDPAKPYLHKGISDVVSTIFKGKNAIAERCSEMFTRNVNGNYEATPSLVAISCAAIWSALQDWSTGELHATDFDEKRFKDVYRVHRSILEKLKTSKPDQYHRTMEHIFAEAA
ncbi:hypothetical protein C8R45DRAFT_1160172 [Mycena sanguinolenta]|nr:hypothetical protein C8R45DRAFT_1160172 [Mycena sanguinolenta]